MGKRDAFDDPAIYGAEDLICAENTLETDDTKGFGVPDGVSKLSGNGVEETETARTIRPATNLALPQARPYRAGAFLCVEAPHIKAGQFSGTQRADENHMHCQP